VKRDHLAFRRQLRQRSTDVERALWTLLRAKRFGGFKFRRQHPVGPYVLDFYCATARLAIEADGGQHFSLDGALRDQLREEFLAMFAIRVVRFTDHEVLVNGEAVLEAIWRALTEGERRTCPSP
jgi:very-short-patch-repair endonuclease